MSTVISRKPCEGRIYSEMDIHAGALVWIERRKAIEKLLLKDYPKLNPVELMGVIRGIELYATCCEELFRELEEGL